MAPRKAPGLRLTPGLRHGLSVLRMHAGEPMHAALSDDEISAALRREDIDIARRTVAKYRQCMGIPSSFERRRQNAMRGETRPDPVDPGAIRP